MDKKQQEQARQIIEHFEFIYEGISSVNEKMMQLAQSDSELSESEKRLLYEFAEGLATILNASQVIEQTARILHRVGSGQMN